MVDRKGGRKCVEWSPSQNIIVNIAVGIAHFSDCQSHVCKYLCNRMSWTLTKLQIYNITLQQRLQLYQDNTPGQGKVYRGKLTNIPKGAGLPAPGKTCHMNSMLVVRLTTNFGKVSQHNQTKHFRCWPSTPLNKVVEYLSISFYLAKPLNIHNQKLIHWFINEKLYYRFIYPFTCLQNSSTSCGWNFHS